MIKKVRIKGREFVEDFNFSEIFKKFWGDKDYKYFWEKSYRYKIERIDKK